MDLDMEEMFGMRNSASRRGSDASGSEGGSGSEGEEDDDGGRNNLMEEALEVPDPETGGGQQTDAAKPIKPKRVIKNPMPKLDATRIAGPRGLPVMQKCFKNVKFHGKGYEKEDLDILLKHLEHWAHRMFPKLPFKDTLEQLEKLGTKKPVQIMMKRIRLDMFFEGDMEGRDEDDVRRGIDEEEIAEPVVDVFDELLGQADFPSAPPASQTQTGGLTDEQRDRLERNRRLAEERRLARLREQEEHERLLEEMDVGTHPIDTNSLPTNTVLDTSETRKIQAESINSGTENENEAMEYEELSSTKTIDGGPKGNNILKRVSSNEQTNSIVNGEDDGERMDNDDEIVDGDNTGNNLNKDVVNCSPQSIANNDFSKEDKCGLQSEGNTNDFKEAKPESLENPIDDKENDTTKSDVHLLASENSDETKTDNVVLNKGDENETGKSDEGTLFTEDDVLGMLDE